MEAVEKTKMWKLGDDPAISSSSSSINSTVDNLGAPNSSSSSGALKKSKIILKRTRKKSCETVDHDHHYEDGNDLTKLGQSPTDAKSSYDKYLQATLDSNNNKLVKLTNSTNSTTGLFDNDCSSSSSCGNSGNTNDIVLIKYKNTVSDETGTGSSLAKANSVQKRREIHSLLIFIFFLFVTIITLSQILVMHSQTNNSNFYQIKLMQEELKLMDASIDKMLKEKHVTPMNQWIALKQYNDNLKRFNTFLDAEFTGNNENLTNSILLMQPLNENEILSSRNLTNMGQVHEHLISELDKCSNLTKEVLMFNLSELKVKLIQVDSFVDNLNSIYFNLINELKSTESPLLSISSGDLFTNTSNLQLFKKHLELYNHTLEKEKSQVNKLTVFNETSEKEKLELLSVRQGKCLQTVIYSLFYYFNKKYSSLFQNNLVNRKHLNQLNVNDFNSNSIEKNSITSLTSTKSNRSTQFKFLKMPLRNMNDYLSKYEQMMSYSVNNLKKKLCDPIPPVLHGSLKVTELKYNRTLFKMIEKENQHVNLGGTWSPPDCQARHKIAIIIPYRDRKNHLITLLATLHPILQRQQLDYKIIVTEQYGNGTFNKPIIMNAAFIYAFEQDNYNCYCFHDVDLVPEDDRNMYSCGRNPKHMSVGIDEMNYKLQYEELIGGVLILRTEHLIATNGYSNLYWGWGAEDDDLYYRLKGLGYKVERPPIKIGRYKMMKHVKRKPQLWSKRAKLLYSSVNRMTWDGISSANYTLLKVTEKRLYTHLLIDVGVPPAGFS